MQNSAGSFSQYDVLLGHPLPGISTDYSLDRYKDHVGNKRFQVMLSMQAAAYEKATSSGDSTGCKEVVDKLVDTVCNQVVPRGRFLESKNILIGNAMPMMHWQKMDDATVKAFLHRVLDNTASPQQISSTESQTFQQDLTSQLQPTLPAPPTPKGLDDGQKRRRRSSLLRRSNSESMLGMFLDNRKKLNLNHPFDPRATTQEEPASWKSSTAVDELNRMDVVFSPQRNALEPSCMSVGNNRLHVLSAVRSSQFQNNDLEAQEGILDEMLETVSTFWRGRFLVLSPGGYDEIKNGEAREIMRIILSGNRNAGGQDNPRRIRHSDPSAALDFGRIVEAEAGQGAAKAKAAAVNLFAANLPSALMEGAQKNQSRALLDLKKQNVRNKNANRLKEKMGVATKKELESEGSKKGTSNQDEQQALFPLGGKVQPSRLSSQSSAGIPSNNNYGYQMSGSLSSLPRQSSARSSFQPRQSTVFNKIDAKAMERLAAEMEELDNDDDPDHPFPASNMRSFGGQLGGNGYGN